MPYSTWKCVPTSIPDGMHIYDKLVMSEGRKKPLQGLVFQKLTVYL